MEGNMPKRTVTVDEVVFYLVEEGFRVMEPTEKNKTVLEKQETTPGKLCSGRDDSETENPDFLARSHHAGRNFCVALDLAQKFGVEQATLDAIIAMYLARSRKAFRLFRGIMAMNATQAVRFAELGASHKVAEELLMDCAKNGEGHNAIALAKLLKRPLGKEEINLLVEDYCTSAHEFEPEETFLVALAKTSLTENEAAEVEEKIRKRRTEFATSDCY
jgi:hypothetical protein